MEYCQYCPWPPRLMTIDAEFESIFFECPSCFSRSPIATTHEEAEQLATAPQNALN